MQDRSYFTEGQCVPVGSFCATKARSFTSNDAIIIRVGSGFKARLPTLLTKKEAFTMARISAVYIHVTVEVARHIGWSALPNGEANGHHVGIGVPSFAM